MIWFVGHVIKHMNSMEHNIYCTYVEPHLPASG